MMLFRTVSGLSRVSLLLCPLPSKLSICSQSCGKLKLSSEKCELGPRVGRQGQSSLWSFFGGCPLPRPSEALSEPPPWAQDRLLWFLHSSPMGAPPCGLPGLEAVDVERAAFPWPLPVSGGSRRGRPGLSAAARWRGPQALRSQKVGQGSGAHKELKIKPVCFCSLGGSWLAAGDNGLWPLPG